MAGIEAPATGESRRERLPPFRLPPPRQSSTLPVPRRAAEAVGLRGWRSGSDVREGLESGRRGGCDTYSGAAGAPVRPWGLDRVAADVVARV